MKKMILGAIAVLATTFGLAGAATAASSNDFYVSAAVGGVYTPNHDNGVAVSVAAGKDFGPIRAEVEYIGSRSATSTTLGTVQSNLGNVNVYVQPFKIGPVTPFVNGGVGYGDVYDKGVHNGVVFNTGLGASIDLTKRLSLVGQYRYFLAKSIKVQNVALSTDNYRASALTLGLRYGF